MDWHTLDPTALFETVRGHTTAADAESMIWALEQAFASARSDPALLDHMAAATLCAIAYRDDVTPRQVAEQLFRRSVGDDAWRTHYAGLIGA